MHPSLPRLVRHMRECATTVPGLTAAPPGSGSHVRLLNNKTSCRQMGAPRRDRRGAGSRRSSDGRAPMAVLSSDPMEQGTCGNLRCHRRYEGEPRHSGRPSAGRRDLIAVTDHRDRTGTGRGAPPPPR